MRKINFLASVLFVALAGSAIAQPTNAIKINLLSPVVRTINLAYEHAINENGSVQLGFFYSGAKVGDTKISGWGLTPEYRFYLSESPAPDGFYVAPFIRYNSFTAEDKSDNTTNKATVTQFGGGVVVGRQWVFKERVTFDIFIGPKYQSSTIKVTQGSDNFSGSLFNNFGIRGGLTLGIAF
ncbi:MAG: DUF3575 domain-containing protein [Bacteroidota bacterium]